RLYYDIQGETYSKQVADILLEKTASEIDGAKYIPGDTVNNPVLGSSLDVKIAGSISLVDKTDTKIELSVENNSLQVEYKAVIIDSENPDSTDNRNATIWKYDDNVYNGYKITDFKLVRGDELKNQSELLSSYNISGDMTYMGSNVVLVLLTLNNPKYGEYKSYRFVKMYNFPDDYGWGASSLVP
ncbi:MAG: hypothetical protein K6F55_11115, partial [Eubacterium sp.]|nr:hypothetical protein [Eubacterium sp.]